MTHDRDLSRSEQRAKFEAMIRYYEDNRRVPEGNEEVRASDGHAFLVYLGSMRMSTRCLRDGCTGIGGVRGSTNIGNEVLCFILVRPIADFLLCGTRSILK